MLAKFGLSRRYLPVRQRLTASLSSTPFDWDRKGIEASTTPPSSWYTDPRFLNEVERRHTFKNWLQICSIHDVRNNGDFFAATVNNQPIVIVNHEGTHRAFFNVCRHHAAQICDNGPGNLGPTGRLTCPYHGWQYNGEGRLVKAVSMKGCKDFSAKNFGLHSILLDKLGPWLYVNFNKEGSSGTIVGDNPDIQLMHDMLAATNYESLVPIKRESYKIKCNWKVFVDNYLDGGYHVPVAHPALSAALNISGYTRTEYPSFYLQSCGAKYGSERVSGGEEGSAALYLYQYPNIMINRYGKWMDTNIVWPLGVDECVVDFVWSVDTSLTEPEYNEAVEESLRASDQVQKEDIWLCERVQAGLQSDGYDVGRYAPMMEGGEYMFHDKLYKDYEASSAHPSNQQK